MSHYNFWATKLTLNIPNRAVNRHIIQLHVLRSHLSPQHVPIIVPPPAAIILPVHKSTNMFPISSVLNSRLLKTEKDLTPSDPESTPFPAVVDRSNYSRERLTQLMRVSFVAAACRQRRVHKFTGTVRPKSYTGNRFPVAFSAYVPAYGVTSRLG